MALYEQEIHQDRLKPLSEVEDHGEETCRSNDQNTKFQSEVKELKQEYWLRLKGKKSALSGNRENAISGKQKNSVQKETLAVSDTTTVGVERRHNRPLLLQGRRHKMTEEDLRKERRPEEAVPLERKVKDRAGIC